MPSCKQPCYRAIPAEELGPGLFAGFQRRQLVTDCWRREGKSWVIRPDPFVDDWTPAEVAALLAQLGQVLAGGGFVYGAFWPDGRLAGFAAVDARPLGSAGQYRDLCQLHVSQEARRQGIGRRLFGAARRFAAGLGGQKLYISAHSAVETQAFYRGWGVWTRWKSSQGMPRPNPLTASWNTACQRILGSLAVLFKNKPFVPICTLTFFYIKRILSLTTKFWR